MDNTLLNLFTQSEVFKNLFQYLNSKKEISCSGLRGSAKNILISSLFKKSNADVLFVASDKESAAYVYNDAQALLGELETLYYPASYKRPYQVLETDNTNVLLRTEVINAISTEKSNKLIVTYPQALLEKVITKKTLELNTLEIKRGDKLSMDFVMEVLHEYQFSREDFVAEPGQYSVRGGIIDVFSFSNELPYRIEFFGDIVESIRSFNVGTQLSETTNHFIKIIPNVQGKLLEESRESFFEFIGKEAVFVFEDFKLCTSVIEKEYNKALQIFSEEHEDSLIPQLKPEELYMNPEAWNTQSQALTRIYLNANATVASIEFSQTPQPGFNKNFDLFFNQLLINTSKGFQNYILTENAKQSERIHTILEDIAVKENKLKAEYIALPYSLHEGFTDNQIKIAVYTDHQLFERFHRYKLKEGFQKDKQALTIKELQNLQPGDFVTHIDHGVGRYAGLEKMEVNGKIQEAVRLVYKDNDVLYVSIHSLHRISKFSSSDSNAPKLNKLGSTAWATLKQKTKKRVKDIAKDLIQLYAKRRAQKGFAFSPDSYLQHELEASFIYEDTRDQYKATQDTKADMEKDYPMDRLVCGDVGFGKTEVAIRAAFKAATDGKQVAVLVPTTILASQHYKTFSSRLKEFPVKVDYVNRFKTGSAEKETLENLEKGKVDIIIGTHRLISKDIKFKDLGLLIIDEEQKFGVAVKDKLKAIKVNVDTLTLTATPIPRTLQFSLMGARDLSVINTPPPNRQPVQTELHEFNEETIRDAIRYEVERGGQVFFIHNRVATIIEIAGLVNRLCPDVKVGIAHGQMDGNRMEQVMLDFVDGDIDVLIATTIIESGLDIANANTIIINHAEMFGLSDLHQMRGRVGRSNRKAFCYLLAPPAIVLTQEARKRLKTIEEFSDLGSGFNIAMRDLDIRGAGNLLGGEQSGFINDIGIEMYQKILDEAIHELKESDFQDLITEEEKHTYVRDCIIETDLEILFPTHYIENGQERLILYKEIDELKDDDSLNRFRIKLEDRFGALPPEAEELIRTMQLRRVAQELGIEKIVMRNNKFIGYFVTDQNSRFYQSENFTKLLKAVQRNSKLKLKENNSKLTLSLEGIKSVKEILPVLSEIVQL